MGGAFKAIGGAFSSIMKGIGDFMSSPFGKLLLGIGLTVLTGGLGAPLMGALGGLGGLGGIGGGALGSIFSGVAGNFLGPFSSMLSGNGLGVLSGFLGQAGGTGDIFNMVGSLINSQRNTDQSNQDASAQEIGNQNVMNLAAYNQARLLSV